MSVGGWNSDEFCVGDVCHEFMLFGGCEETVCFNAEDERSGREGGEDGGDGCGGLGFGGLWDEVWVGGVGGTSPSEVVRVHFARDVNVTVGVESGNKLGALIAEIGLS